MAGPTRKRKSATKSDFKRIKAKVGKKALKPANVTDTSFKAASVSVKNQADTFVRARDKKLVSDRGHSIQELATQLNHPAAAVRTSAIRGLSNIVDSYGEHLKAHLSVLLPAVSKCCVDEDDTVRQLGLTVLHNILNLEDECVLGPFLALLTAYTTSALNSLDRSTRLDGAKAVEILSTTLPSLMGSQVHALLPAFVALLTDYTKRRRPDKTSGGSAKKRKKAGEAVDNSQFTILQGLVALLRTVPDSKHVETTHGTIIDEGKSDLVFVSGGRTVNALFVAPAREMRSVRPINNINELTSFMNSETNETTVNDKDVGLSASVATEIISKLRDIFIELSQRSEGTSQGGTLLGAASIEELSLLNEAIHLFWNGFCYDIIQQGSNDFKETQALRKVFLTVLSLMMESFPVLEQSSNAELAAKSALLNAEMCVALMDIGGYLEADSKEIDWTRKVLDYLLPRLESDASVSTQSDNIVDVLSKLLLLKHNSTGFSLPDKTRRKVLDRICKVFFAEELKPDVARLASSRRAVLLIVEMLRNENFVIVDDTILGTLLRKAFKRLPYYLHAWRGDFLAETSAVLSTLQDVGRRIDLDSESTRNILECLRTGLSLIFEIPKRMKKAKRSQLELLPIFELYPEEMQRQALGLLVMIRSPSESTIDGLGYMCARSGTVEGAISPIIANAVMYAVYSVRRSMSMQAYLSLLVASIGIANFNGRPKEKSGDDPLEVINHNESSLVAKMEETAKGGDLRDEQQVADVLLDIDVVKASEASVLRAARYFTLCGSKKVLPMMYEVLNEWITALSPDVGLEPSHRAIKFRAAVAIITMLFLDMNDAIDDTKSQVSAAIEAPAVVPSLCNLFEFCFLRHTASEDSVDAFEYLMQPIMVRHVLSSALLNFVSCLAKWCHVSARSPA